MSGMAFPNRVMYLCSLLLFLLDGASRVATCMTSAFWNPELMSSKLKSAAPRSRPYDRNCRDNSRRLFKSHPGKQELSYLRSRSQATSSRGERG